MRNISLGQVLVLLFLCFMLFGDFVTVKKKLLVIVKKSVEFISQKNRRKGS